MDTLDRSFVKVRKKRNGKLHRCHQCNREIPIGTIVECGTYVDEYIYKIYTCQVCLEYMHDFRDELIDKWERTIEEHAILQHLEGGNFGRNCDIDEDAYWRKVRYYGYGEEKWEI